MVVLLTASDTELILYATIQRLNDQNFRFETKTCADPQRDAMWEGSVVPSLKSYKQVHGDLKVPKMFVVPSERGTLARRGLGVEAARNVASSWRSWVSCSMTTSGDGKTPRVP